MKLTIILALATSTLLTTSVLAQPLKLEKAEPVNAKALAAEAAQTIALTLPTVNLSFDNKSKIDSQLLAINLPVAKFEQDKKPVRVVAE